MYNKPIFIINGQGGAGKDEFIKCIDKYVRVFNVSSITPVKSVARMLGWDGIKTEKDRKFLSDMKNLLVEYNNLPYNYVCEKITSFKTSNCFDMMFIHIREPEEIEKIKSMYPSVRTIYIENDNVEPITSNDSDANVGNYEYDFVFSNNGTLEELDKKSYDFLKEVYDMEDWEEE